MSGHLWSSEEARTRAFDEVRHVGTQFVSGNKKQAAVHAVGAAACLGVMWRNSQCDCGPDDHPDHDTVIFGVSGPGAVALTVEQESDLHAVIASLGVSDADEMQTRMAAFPGSSFLLKFAIKVALKKLEPEIKELLAEWFGV